LVLAKDKVTQCPFLHWFSCRSAGRRKMGITCYRWSTWKWLL